jgi:glycosyltransferase involved in cell wall biosynthesis
MRVGLVVPRYGTEVLGGAELAFRELAEHVSARPGWSVDVYTTCALDASTWRNEYEPGTVTVNGVAVHRFASRSGRGADFANARAAALLDPARATPSVSERFVEQLGPVCPDAVAAAANSTCEVLACGPYLYHPVVSIVGHAGRRAVLHPAAHDEPEIRLPVYRTMFEQAGGLVFWSDSEAQLAASLFPCTATVPQLVLGLGVESHDGDAEAARAAVGLDDRPYVLCLGRMLAAKGTTMLSRFFGASQAARRRSLQLVFAGPIVDAPPAGADIVVAGPVDEAIKWGLVRGAAAVVSPSPYESLSIVLLEAWSEGVPVLVNGTCAVTVDQCARAGGGLWFSSFETFDVALDRLVRHAGVREQLGRAGKAFVEQHCAWPVVVDRYVRFLERMASRQPGFRAT